MNKRFLSAVLLGLWFAPLFADDWRPEIMSRLVPGQDYAGAAARLREMYPTVNEEDKANALGFLAFLERKSGALDKETERMVEYFETYGARDPVFLILDDSLRQGFLEFWAKWKSSYPLVDGIAFLERTGETDSSPPARLLVGLDLSNNAYYKISNSGGVLEGGFWSPGFHILKLPFSARYDRTGLLEFDLDLKSGNLVIRKRISIDVEVGSAPPTFSLTPLPAGEAGRAAKPLHGEVSLYINDALILTSRKTAAPPPPIRFKLPGPSPEGTKPYMAPKRDFVQGVSILDAIGVLYKTIKDIGKKKAEAAIVPPTYRKTAQLSFSYSRPGNEGESVTLRSRVSLKTRTATVVER
jgi:hypothetical protein